MGGLGLSSFPPPSEIKSLGTLRKFICGLAEGSPLLGGDNVADARFTTTNKSKNT